MSATAIGAAARTFLIGIAIVGGIAFRFYHLSAHGFWGDDAITPLLRRFAYVRPHIADFTYADFRFSAARSAHIEVNGRAAQLIADALMVGVKGYQETSHRRPQQS